MGDTFFPIDCPHHPDVRVSSVIDAFGVCDESGTQRAGPRPPGAGLDHSTARRKPSRGSVRSEAIEDGRTPLVGNNFNREPRIADSKNPNFRANS